jgi:YesN/AraC family two-component response regulator
MANILIVDDEKALRQGLVFVLVRLGHTVWEADDGEQALRVVAKQVPDLIITDIFMPEKDGIEVIQEMQRLHPQVPLIAMSGGIQGDYDTFLKMAKRLGVEATLSKPFSIQDFRATVEKVLGSGS